MRAPRVLAPGLALPACIATAGDTAEAGVPGVGGDHRLFVFADCRVQDGAGFPLVPAGARNEAEADAAMILRGPLIRFAGDPFELGDAALVYEPDGALAVEAGLIAAVGPAEAVLRGRSGEVRRTPHLIAPGFVDCHMHYPQIGIIASHGAQLVDWLNRYTFPEEARFSDPVHSARAARASLDEQLRHGVTCAASFCTVHAGSADAFFAEAARRGVRAVGGKVLMDRNAPADLRDTPQSAHDDSAALIARWHGAGRAVYAISPRFAPTSSPGQLEAAGALRATHPDCLLQTHLSENPREVAWVAELYPDAPDYLAVYERFGLVGPRAVFGHAIHLTPRERAALAEQGASVAHCPTSNQFLGSGECDVAGLVARGVRLGLASDTGGGTSYSPFATMRAAYEVAHRRGAALEPAELWWLATAGAARALHLEAQDRESRAGSRGGFRPARPRRDADPAAADRPGRGRLRDAVCRHRAGGRPRGRRDLVGRPARARPPGSWRRRFARLGAVAERQLHVDPLAVAQHAQLHRVAGAVQVEAARSSSVVLTSLPAKPMITSPGSSCPSAVMRAGMQPRRIGRRAGLDAEDQHALDALRGGRAHRRADRS